LYNEANNTLQTIAQYLYADGTVIMDGSGKGAYAVFNYPGARSVRILPHPEKGGKWIFRNYSGTSIINATSTGTVTNVLDCCELYSNTNSFGFYDISGTAYGRGLTISNSIFVGNFVDSAIYIAGAASSPVTIYNVTIYNATRGIYRGADSASQSTIIRDSIISNCTTAWHLNQAFGATTIITRNQYYSITNWKASSTTYTALADVQTAGQDSLSIVSDPQFEDPTNGIVYLKSISSISRTQGAVPFGYTTGSGAGDAKWIVTATADNSGWYCSDGSVTKNGSTGFFELTSGLVGVLYSPVIDLTTVQVVKQVNLSVDQSWPVGMVDTTKTDVKPNYQTVEIRASGVAFNQGDGSPSWTEVKTEQNFVPVVGRFVQLKLTFRGDDVGA
jgi:hypothetical protein